MAVDDVPGPTPSSFALQSPSAVNAVMERLLTFEGYDPRNFTLKKQDTGKPFGLLDGRQVGVGITHCRSLLVCALHTEGEIGIDVEHCDRLMHPALRKRISHPDEQQFLPDELCNIRLWTVKEAVLKFMGTGLRRAMNKIKLDMADDYCFKTELEEETVKVASFPFRNHWVAVAFRNSNIMSV